MNDRVPRFKPSLIFIAGGNVAPLTRDNKVKIFTSKTNNGSILFATVENLHMKAINETTKEIKSEIKTINSSAAKCSNSYV